MERKAGVTWALEDWSDDEATTTYEKPMVLRYTDRIHTSCQVQFTTNHLRRRASNPDVDNRSSKWSYDTRGSTITTLLHSLQTFRKI